MYTSLRIYFIALQVLKLLLYIAKLEVSGFMIIINSLQVLNFKLYNSEWVRFIFD